MTSSFGSRHVVRPLSSAPPALTFIVRRVYVTITTGLSSSLSSRYLLAMFFFLLAAVVVITVIVLSRICVLLAFSHSYSTSSSLVYELANHSQVTVCWLLCTDNSWPLADDLLAATSGPAAAATAAAVKLLGYNTLVTRPWLTLNTL